MLRLFRRLRGTGMKTVLDSHYSDTWADPSAQVVPAAWVGLDDGALAAAVEEYTFRTLVRFRRRGVLPAWVQAGNETNAGMFRGGGDTDRDRQALLFAAGIRGVRRAEERSRRRIGAILHVAQPENSL